VIWHTGADYRWENPQCHAGAGFDFDGGEDGVQRLTAGRVAAAGTIAALTFAAFDWLLLAAAAAIVTAIVLITSPAMAAIRALPRDARSGLIDTKLVRNAAILGTVLSCVHWAGWIPMNLQIPSPLRRAWRLLDFVPSCFAQILPLEVQSGLHQYFRHGTYCFPGEVWWETTRYLRTAVPANTISAIALLVSLRVIRSIAKHHRAKRAANGPVSFS
jgi:hypothetical protein